VLLSITLFFAGLEIFLRVMDRDVGPQPSSRPAVSSERFAGIPKGIVDLAESRKRLLTMPEEWKERPVDIAGAARSYYWLGSLQIFNEDQMRHLGAFPPHRQGVFRVIVVGDSLTYGYGIAEEATFTHLLNDWMSRRETVEFLNLGVPGAQSEDIANTIEKFIPRLKPDLIIYAVCQNDFLPSGVGQYEFTYAFPLPESTKAFLLKHSRALQVTSDLYDAALRRVHLRRDFFDDILRDFDNYQGRFRRDVKRMEALAAAAGLPPIVGILVDQFPALDSRGHKISRIAEQAMQAAGFDVISTEDYYRRYTGDDNMYVSRWEGHPNEIANYIWASMIADHLRSEKYLKPFL
jgi:lysophospholipase L1-like esterase